MKERGYDKLLSDITIEQLSEKIVKLAKQRDEWQEKAMNMVEKSTYEQKLKGVKFWKEAYDEVIKLQGKGYVFSEIPNDTDGQEFVDKMKKYFNKTSYKMRVRGQHIKPELKGTGATYWGQSKDESTHLRVYIDAKKGE